MKNRLSIDGHIYRLTTGYYTTKSEAAGRAKEIRKVGFRGEKMFARVVRSEEKEIGFKKGAGGVHTMQYQWYIYVRRR